MQVTDVIKERFGTWLPYFQPFIESAEFDKIFEFLKAQKSLSRIVLPESKNVFKSFELCDASKVKAVIVLMDPYPSVAKDGVIIADGVPMSCNNTGVMQPSLEIFYQGIEHSYFGTNPAIDKRPDCSYLMTEEGVMLINSSLTCEKDKPGSHASVWTPFMKFFFETVLDNFSGLPIVFCGAQAQRFERYINPLRHYIFKVEHPVAANYSNRAWDYKDMFKWCNSIISNNNGKEFMIKWHRMRPGTEESDTTEKCNETKKPFSTNKEPLKSAEELGLPWKD